MVLRKRQWRKKKKRKKGHKMSVTMKWEDVLGAEPLFCHPCYIYNSALQFRIVFPYYLNSLFSGCLLYIFACGNKGEAIRAPLGPWGSTPADYPSTGFKSFSGTKSAAAPVFNWRSFTEEKGMEIKPQAIVRVIATAPRLVLVIKDYRNHLGNRVS
jgi:hypothetical protein